MMDGAPDKKEVEKKEQHLRESIAKNYSHIKNVEAQLAQLQLQLNLTSGPKKSALEMLRKKIEAKNEQVVAARQKFMSAQKVAEQAEEVLKWHESSKEQLCQELHLLVHQSATAELNKLEQLTKQLDQLNGGSLRQSSELEAAAVNEALARRAVSTSNTPSAEDAAAATTAQQALAAADAASQPSPASTQAATSAPDAATNAAEPKQGQPHGSAAATEQPTLAEQQSRQPHLPSSSTQSAQQHAQQIGRKKSNQNRRQLVKGSNEVAGPQVASDSAGRFAGFKS